MTTNPQAARYRHRSPEIEAVQWTGLNADALRAFCGPDFDEIELDDRVEDPDQTAAVREADHGTWRGLAPGDWVVRLDGGLYEFSAADFAKQYELAVVPVPVPAPTNRAARRERYAQALLGPDAAGTLDAAADEMLAAVMAVADAEQAELRRERDLAIAHDRQPYPTAWAYEQACAALHRKTEAIERVRALHVPDGNGECQHCGRSFDPCPTIAALDTQPADGPGRVADEAQQPECSASVSGNCLREAQSETACDTEAGECVYGGKPGVEAQQPETQAPDVVTAIVTALQERAGELSALAEEQMRPRLEERAQEWLEAAEVARRAAKKRPATEAPFIPPAHYRRDDGVECCVHTIPVGPDSCRHCRELADDQPAAVSQPGKEG